MNAPLDPSRLVTRLEDRYTVERGWLYMTGTQALVRLPIQQRLIEAAAGRSTGGYISGYRGSPMGRYDMELWAADKVLKAHNIHFRAGVNEDLAATALWGAQYVGSFPGAKVDGVFGIWYGKGPGVDRAGDAMKHGNAYGSSPNGGVLVIAGERQECRRKRYSLGRRDRACIPHALLVGMTIFPGRSYLRCDYVFINPTNHRQPFQYWSTSATHANEWAQAQYPGDMVTGHGKHEFWNWPIHEGVDLTWYKNIPVPTSYMVTKSSFDFFGGYDHGAQAGIVHVADHHVSPGKKLWTWSKSEFGHAWDRELTDSDGPYIELMAGVFTTASRIVRTISR